MKNLLIILALVMFFCSGCTIKKIAVYSIGNMLSGDNSLVFTGEEDPELVGDALPFALKLYESLLEKTPHNKRLLAATGKAFVMYAFAFVQSPADQMTEDQLDLQRMEKQRAKKLYLRGRDYLLSALDEYHPGFTAFIIKGLVDSALAMTNDKDTSNLYWTGMAWMGALTVDKEDIGLMVTMPKAVAFIDRAGKLNADFGNGSIDEFYLSYYGGLPASMGGSEEKARRHFARALELSKGKKAGPYVSLASAVSIRNQNIKEFKDLLQKAIAVDVSQRDKYRLTNVIYQQKAHWLLKNTDRFFVDDSTGE
jgi:predicted anti-sigma-YlaC factor YlaD